MIKTKEYEAKSEAFSPFGSSNTELTAKSALSVRIK